MLSVPHTYILETDEGMPAYTPRGIRMSAIRAPPNDRVNDVAWPYTRRLVKTKKLFKKIFSAERLERLDRMIEASNATMYSKLANCVLDLKKQDNKDVKKKRGWSESEWKKHMDYIGQMAAPKRDFKPDPIKRGPCKTIEGLIPRLRVLAMRPEFKCYRRLSKEEWYRDPEKVSRQALKYVLTDRTKKLAVARVIPTSD